MSRVWEVRRYGFLPHGVGLQDLQVIVRSEGLEFRVSVSEFAATSVDCCSGGVYFNWYLEIG